MFKTLYSVKEYFQKEKANYYLKLLMIKMKKKSN